MLLPDRYSFIILLAVLVTVSYSDRAENNGPVDALYSRLPITDTLSVFLKERYAGKLIGTLSADGGKIVNRIALSVEMKVPGGVQHIALEEVRIYRREGRLVTARQKMETPAGSNLWELSGDTTESWWLTVNTAGTVNRRKVAPVHEHIRSIVALYNGLFTNTLKKGTTWTDTSMELTSGEPVVTVTRCEATPRDGRDSCWEFICTNSLVDQPEYWKIDRHGKTVYRDMYPYTARRWTSASALSEQRITDADAMFEMMKVAVPGKIRPGKEMLVLTFNNGQRVDSSVAGWYEPYEKGYRLKPLRKKCGTTVENAFSDAEKKAYCAPTPTLQSTHPRIRQLADSLGTGISNPCKKVAVFNHAVYAKLDKKNIATFSSALETLEAGYGDCGEHAVLLAALLRSAGIPARVVLGLLYVPPKKGYYYHAWVMAYTGSWVFADPSHDRFPAGNDRVPLVIDDDGTRMVALAKILGRLSIDHLPIKKR